MSQRPSLAAVVLAAGRSKRFASSAPKVLHPLLGRPLIAHVMATLAELHRTHPVEVAVVVVPPGKAVEPVVEGFQAPFPVSFVVQRKPLGTGDAAKLAIARIEGTTDEVLVLAGDSPLLRAGTLGELVRERGSADAAVAVLTAELPDPGDYGRVLRDEEGHVVAVVEARDATIAERHVKEVNTSTYVFARDALAETLPRLRADNAQAEYYLTDAVRLLVDGGRKVLGVRAAPDEALGANTRQDFALLTRVLRRRVLDRLMEGGVTVVDPDSTFVDVDVTVGPDSVLLPMTVLEGATRIGTDCEIGPNVRIVDSTVGDGTRVTFAVVRSSKIGPECDVGPFASLRPGTVLRRKAKAGTFVEMKEADIGEGSKVPHLSYMGDVTVGRGSNVGAGTITCNYDGVEKHRTVIGDEAFIGTDTILVAPVRVGSGAYTGAGSVVTKDVKPGQTVYGVPARLQPSPKRVTAKKPSKKAPAKKRGKKGA